MSKIYITLSEKQSETNDLPDLIHQANIEKPEKNLKNLTTTTNCNQFLHANSFEVTVLQKRRLHNF